MAWHLGLDLAASGLPFRGIYEAVRAPGHSVRTVWHDQVAADEFETTAAFPEDALLRQIRTIYLCACAIAARHLGIARTTRPD